MGSAHYNSITICHQLISVELLSVKVCIAGVYIAFNPENQIFRFMAADVDVTMLDMMFAMAIWLSCHHHLVHHGLQVAADEVMHHGVGCFYVHDAVTSHWFSFY